MLRSLNAPPNDTSFFGVNGIDNDPHAHPYANPEHRGKPCTSTEQCGGLGNLCMRVSVTSNVCGTVCLDDAGCPDGYRCTLAIQSGETGTSAMRACKQR